MMEKKIINDKGKMKTPITYDFENIVDHLAFVY